MTTYQIVQGSRILPRLAPESLVDVPEMLLRLAAAGLQSQAPRRLLSSTGGGPLSPGPVDPAPDAFPRRLAAAAAQITFLLDADPDDPRLLPTRRPTATDRETWLEELTAHGRTQRVETPEVDGLVLDVLDLVTVFDNDWPLDAQWQPIPAPEVLITGDPSKVSEPVRIPGGDPRDWSGWERPDNGAVDPWLAETFRGLEVYADLIVTRRTQYAAAKTIITAGAGKGMSSQHRKEWSDCRFHAKGQVESLTRVITRIASQLYAEMSPQRVLAASYPKAR